MAIADKPRKIDADTHFTSTVEGGVVPRLKDMLTRTQYAEAKDLLYKTSTQRRPGAQRSGEQPPDPSRDADFRLTEMDRLGFDTQVLNTQDAMPSPLNSITAKPLWLRIPLATLYNEAALKLQNDYPGRYIAQATIPWDDIPASIAEMERVAKQGMKAVQIKGSYYNGHNLDAPELYPFWEAVEGFDLCTLVHNTTQGCGSVGGTIAEHDTTYPMVGTERYHRLHIGTYLGFGIDYIVACAALSLGGVLDEFPGLRFAFFEGGASWFSHAMLGADRSFYIEGKCSRTKTRPSELLKQHCMTAIESLEPIEQMVEAYGSDNYILGSDFPHPEFQFLPNAPSDVTDKPGLSAEAKNKILGGNIARFLKVSPVIAEVGAGAGVRV